MRFIYITMLLSLVFCGCVNTEQAMHTEPPPNVVIIFLDDAGYGDFSPFGKPDYPTPNVEKLAEQGMRFNQFYVPQAVCSASRSVLMSGCYPGRTRVFGAHGPNGRGLDPKFTTMAEMLKKVGYATAHYGKWHCGDQPETRPLARGFDEHAGLMYSNDMWRFNPKRPEYWGQFPLRYWKNGEIFIEDVSKKDQESLTKWSTEYAVDFIKRNREKPFFVYLAHSMPHVPLYCSPEFKGKSGVGLYGDVMMEIDWSVGEIMRVLEEVGVEENTIVLFSSDNGPWTVFGNHAGVTPFRAHKATSFDGGIRSATVMKFPPKLKGGTQLDRAISSLDMLPTIAHLTGAELPSNEIDGKNVWSLIAGEDGAENPHGYYPLSIGKRFEGVVSGDGKWKLHLPHQYRHAVKPGNDGGRGEMTILSIDLSLFDMEHDPYETTNVIDKYPEVAKRLKALAEAHKNKYYDEK
ncbi:hypothetical protein BVX97_02065 [bacterium E08(2017)]|nr:hypothetical protein BVX97_02065 [bacterium E08(2017)]